MPQYMYECEKCSNSHYEIHSMSEDPIITCQKCGGECFRAIQPVNGYVRGSCYLNKNDCKKQATLHTLKENDPYARHRQPGEKDDLISKMKNGGKNKKSVSVNGLKK